MWLETTKMKESELLTLIITSVKSKVIKEIVVNFKFRNALFIHSHYFAHEVIIGIDAE